MEEPNLLSKFLSTQPKSIFPEATQQLPEFLNQNLLDPNRVIKYFYNDSQAAIRVFYYQYLKLCFEMEQPECQIYITKIEEILANQQFKFIFSKNTQNLTTFQAKQLIFEFMQYLSNQEKTVENALNYYPIMDQIFIAFIRTLLISAQLSTTYEENIPREELFQFLAAYFCLDIALYENCLKFIDSDVFMYQEQQEEVYMIFIDYEQGLAQEHQETINEQSDSEGSSVQQIISKVNISEDRSQNVEQSEQLQKDSGIYDFVDFTGVQQEKSKEDYAANISLLKVPSNDSNDHKNSPVSINYDYDPSKVIWEVPEALEELLSSGPRQNSSNLTSSNKGTEKYKITPQEITNENYSQVRNRQNSENFVEEVNLEAKAKIVISQHSPSSILENRVFGRSISNNFESNINDNSIDTKGKFFTNPLKKNSFNYDYTNEHFNYNYNYLKNLSKQFTNSILLKQLKQPHNTNIQLMKIRARAQRSTLGSYQY